VAESKSILIGLSFRLSPSNVCDLLAQEPNHERILTFDFERIHGEELRDPICNDLVELFPSHRLEAAQQLWRDRSAY
jgi:hypothetical protein